jgi:CMP-N-acetylneuraminic acid synthetase
MAVSGLNKKPTIIALVPMRHSSERVPGKNYRDFAGMPLYRHIVTSLLKCPLIATVVIDTDSPNIRQDVAEHFPDVMLIKRPAHLTAGTVPMNDVLMHDVRQIDADFYLQTHSTNPLLRAETITRAIQQFLDTGSIYDSLFSVTKLQTRLWDALGRAINHNPNILLRTQDLPPVYLENSCLYLFSRTTLESTRNRIGQRPLMFEIDKIEAWDIDEELDFRIAEYLCRQNDTNEEYTNAAKSP